MEGKADTSDLLNAQEQRSGFDWAKGNVFNPILNSGPLAVYNTAADLVNLPTVHLKQDEAKPYSKEWFTQGLASGVGSAVPFMLVGAGTKYAFGAANGALAETTIGNALKPVLTSELAAQVTGAALFGALQKPDETHTRLGNALGMGVGFMVFNRGNNFVKDFGTAGRIASLPVIGFAGGVTMSEASQFLSNGKFSTADQVIQAGVQGMTMNTVMGLAAQGLKRDSERAEAQRMKLIDKQISELDLGKTEGKVSIVLKDDRGLSSQIPRDLNEIIKQSKAYSEWVRENKVQYPTPEEFAKLSKDQIAQRGFLHPDLQALEVADLIEAFKDKKPRPLPDAKVVASEVKNAVADMPLAGKTGPLIYGQWNMEFLTADKAQYFADTYKHVVPRHHLMFVQETDKGGLSRVAADNGYKFNISEANSRGQAVGFLVNERLKVTGEHSYNEVAKVHNIPDLRPAFRIDFTDTATGDKSSAVVVHLKSMRGGPEQTAAVRALQASILAKALGPDFKGVVAGDFNNFLDKAKDMDPLKKAGFKLLNPGDTSTTQSMGGRLDGFFVKGMEGFTDPDVRPFFKNPKITRGLSDHALLTTQIKTGS